MPANTPVPEPPATSRIDQSIERARRVAEATRPLRSALNQGEHYTDLRGVDHPLSQMCAAEALLVLVLLERHAGTLHRGELAERLLNPGAERQRVDRTPRELTAIEPSEWLRRTPLHHALTERASQ